MLEHPKIAEIIGKHGLVVSIWPKGLPTRSMEAAENSIVHSFDDMKTLLWKYLQGDHPNMDFLIRINADRYSGWTVASGNARTTRYYVIDYPDMRKVDRIDGRTDLFLEAMESTTYLSASERPF